MEISKWLSAFGRIEHTSVVVLQRVVDRCDGVFGNLPRLLRLSGSRPIVTKPVARVSRPIFFRTSPTGRLRPVTAILRRRQSEGPLLKRTRPGPAVRSTRSDCCFCCDIAGSEKHRKLGGRQRRAAGAYRAFAGSLVDCSGAGSGISGGADGLGSGGSCGSSIGSFGPCGSAGGTQRASLPRGCAARVAFSLSGKQRLRSGRKLFRPRTVRRSPGACPSSVCLSSLFHVIGIESREHDRIDRASFLAEAAVDALKKIDVVAARSSHAIVADIRVNCDRQRGANRFAKLARNASFLAVRVAP